MDKIKNEDSCQETLESGDPTKSSIIEGQIKVVNRWFEDEFDKLRRRIEEQQYRAEGLQHSIMVIEDDQGETYVKLQGARKEKLAALLIRPAINAAQIVTIKRKDKTEYFSHRMKIEKIKKQSTKAHIKADILICRLLTDDRDHDIADGNVFMKRKRHYLFDFGVAFPQYDYDHTDGNFCWSPDFGKEADKFIDEPESSGFKVTEFFCSIFYFLFSDIKEQKKALNLLKAKHSFLKSQYEGEEGLKLISSMCEKSGFSNGDLSEITKVWKDNGPEKLQFYLLNRINILQKVIESLDSSLRN